MANRDVSEAYIDASLGGRPLYGRVFTKQIKLLRFGYYYNLALGSHRSRIGDERAIARFVNEISYISVLFRSHTFLARGNGCIVAVRYT
jgi:hypothetical protein